MFSATAMAQTAARATLNPTGGSSVSGVAALTARGDQTVVLVQVSGAPPNSTHVNHIHIGSCQAEGGIVHPLADLRTDAQGRATSITVLNVPLASVAGGQHYVNVHAGPALPSPGISCGNLTAGPAGLPATGQPLSAALGGGLGVALPAAGIMAMLGAGVVTWRRRVTGQR
ncbi:MAG TPA: CHRD domain-containing protein [Chloroflexota bacterium]|nr:CHRD domain-containing protein [Chloroflexota bacterium]